MGRTSGPCKISVHPGKHTFSCKAQTTGIPFLLIISLLLFPPHFLTSYLLLLELPTFSKNLKTPSLALPSPVLANYSAVCRPAEHLAFKLSSQDVRRRLEKSCEVCLFLDGITAVHQLGSVHSEEESK